MVETELIFWVYFFLLKKLFLASNYEISKRPDLIFLMHLYQEKSIPPSRLISCLIAFSILLLIHSWLSLLEYGPYSSISISMVHNINTTCLSPTKTPSLANQALNKHGTTILKVVSQGLGHEYTRKQQCDRTNALLKVYMYDLPPELHFGMLGWKGRSSNETWPNLRDIKRLPSYPGGLNLQHSPEYWLTLDLLASNDEKIVRPCSAYRVKNPTEADVLFVPFFSSLSYNRHSKRRGRGKATDDWLLQEKLVEFLEEREEWKKFGGRGHLVVAHHPNSMLVARKKLASSMFVLADFGRYKLEIANVDKDVIAPYKHMVKSVDGVESPSFDQRPTLIYFRGAITRKDGGAIRLKLYHLLKKERDVQFGFGSVRRNGVKEASKGMASSRFCLTIAGDTPSSNRLFDAIASHCVPVIISDEIELPFEDVLDYSEFCVFVFAKDAVKKGYLLNLLRGIKQERWTKMWERLKEISVHFEYQYPSQENDAVDMIWQTISRKKTPTQLNAHRRNRYSRWQFQ